MKKKTLFLLCTFLLLAATAISVSAFTLTRASVHLTDDVTLIKSGLAGEDILFSEADIKQALGVTDFEYITVASLPDPADGTLKLGGVRVVLGQKIEKEHLPLLRFTPSGELTKEATFSFTAGSLAGGAEIPCILRFLPRVNYAPTVKGAALSAATQKDTAIHGSLSGADPEGDDLTYLIVSYPKKGTLSVTNSAYGDFVYRPRAGYTGKDSFSYVVRDSYGNYSTVAVVTVTVSGTVSESVYRDMENHRAAYAAAVLAEENIMLGRLLGDGLYFEPSEQVSREDFLVMAMKAAGISPDGGTEVFFDDKEELHPSLLPYVATAAKRGYVLGVLEDGRLNFNPDTSITRAEAATILYRILKTPLPTTLPVFADGDDLPSYAKAAIYSLFDAGILDRREGGVIAARQALTRAEAAEMLLSVKEYLS